MARKKRGGKISAGKKVRQHRELCADEHVIQSPADESEESCSSGTPKSCNTPIELEKQSSNTTLVQHKKFGKFRCLLLEDVNRTEISSSESEIQADSVDMEGKHLELLLDSDNLIGEIKCVDLCDTDTLEDIPVSAEEIVHEEMTLDSMENVCELHMIDEASQQSGILLTVEGLDKEPDERSVAPDLLVDSKIDSPCEPRSDSPVVRRSSRIRSITVLKQRNKGHGLVKTKLNKGARAEFEVIAETGSSNGGPLIGERVPSAESPSFVTPTITVDSELKPVKVKSRWRRSSELEMGSSSPLVVPAQSSPLGVAEGAIRDAVPRDPSPAHDEELEIRMRQFHMLTENQYLTARVCCKEAKKMVCDCFLTTEEVERGELACGQDCLNRLLMIECGSGCVVGDRCTNKRFQNLQYAPCEVFRTEKKGYGIRATAEIPFGEFILEYVGEVVGRIDFEKRAKEYSKDNNEHYYFMALRTDAVIDATQKGNISRFINHSCDPNAETQKWTVNGELRIGFFSTRTIVSGEEITFDYHFQRYGKEAQKCYCEASTCRGWIGEEPEDEEEDEDESERDEEIEYDENKELDSAENEIKSLKRVARPYRRRKPAKIPRIDLFEDSDLDEVIGTLCTTGVKNQLHTLKLSRLMVRAKDVGPRMKLLQLLREGDLPCRRLFLDYHGLRLIHGWMCDAHNISDSDEQNLYKKEILLTLASLPIPNKTMLIDSKVLETVEIWSTGATVVETSPADSESNSPQISSSSPPVSDLLEKEEVEMVGADSTKDDLKLDEMMDMKEEVVEIELDVVKEEADDKIDKDEEKVILEVTTKLMNDWSVLKEIFRIPKKERIEQMKEHEREADRDYKASGHAEADGSSKRYSCKGERSRISDKERRKGKDAPENERTVTKKGVRIEERNIVPVRKLSKHERRQLFALQVAQEDEGRRRKHEQELWRQHEQRCIAMGVDPRITNFDAAANYCYWNQNTGTWQNYEVNGTQRPAVVPSPSAAPSTTSDSTSTSEQPASNEDWAVHYPPGTVFPPPVKLPPKWKMARDCYGRPYYFDVKTRIPQWLPPDLPPEDAPVDMLDESSSSSESSSVSSDTTTDSDEDIEIGDTRLMLDIRNKLNNSDKENSARVENITNSITKVDIKTESPKQETPEEPLKSNELVQKRKRDGLVQEIIISPRREEDKIAHKAELRKYRETKEKLRRQKQLLLEQSKKRLKNKLSKTNSSKTSKKHRSSKSLKHKMRSADNSEEAKKVKEQFRSSMAGVMVQYLNAYRKPDCKVGRITNTDDFKHLARKSHREEDKVDHKAEFKKYRETKEKLRRQKELLLEQNQNRLKNKLSKTNCSKSSKKHHSSKSLKHKMRSAVNSEEAQKVKEQFRSSMASVMVQYLNAYRKPDCKVGRITNTHDFKHLARKLTHFVMVKELKHCQNIEELICNESVKSKAKDFVKKYMSKFGEAYVRSQDDLE